MLVYGYTIIIRETVGHGMPWWSEYYETIETKQLEHRLFKDKEKRDAEMSLALNRLKEQYNISVYGDDEIEAIPTESYIE